ncbi:MAG: hypothetical protein WBA36_13015 [Mesorhizobium sp.]
MKRIVDDLTIKGSTTYDSSYGTAIGGGTIVSAHFIRKTDGVIAVVDDLSISARGTGADRDMTISIGEPLLLPGFLADLVLALPEGDETADEFNHRLKLRDELAKAFEDAAAKLRSAPRR